MGFVLALFDGLSLGGMYAMIALGYTMVYGIAKMLNFAHGDIIMVGAYAMFTAVSSIAVPAPIAVLIGIVVCVLLGVLTEKIAYKPLRDAPSLAVLITAIGVSWFLQNLALIVFGPAEKMFPLVITLPAIQLGALTISGATWFTLLATLVIMVGLTMFINTTRTGRAMLAVSEDRNAAKLMGINVNRTITITFAIGSALAAVASLCYGMTYKFVGPYIGAMPGIKAFIAAVVGGIGSIPGAMLGGILLGLVEVFAKTYISTDLADAIVFGILIIILLIRPTGILGKKRSEKV